MARILCIEDEDFIRQDIADELTDAGHDVVQAENGADGLKAIITQCPDLVLCDISMPVMDGHTMLTELRENHPSYDDMPFLFLSALADRDDVIAGKRLGADDYLTKPIDFGMLHATVESRLRQVGRMSERREEQLVKLYKALSGGDPPTAGETGAAVAAATGLIRDNPDALRLTIIGSAEETATIGGALRAKGHTVATATSAAAFHQDCKDSAPDLLLITAAVSQRDRQLAGVLADIACPKVLLMPRPLDDAEPADTVPGFDAVVGWQDNIEAFDGEIGAVAACYAASKKFAGAGF